MIKYNFTFVLIQCIYFYALWARTYIENITNHIEFKIFDSANYLMIKTVAEICWSGIDPFYPGGKEKQGREKKAKL